MNFETSFSFHTSKLCRCVAWCLLLLMLGSFCMEKSQVSHFNFGEYGWADDEAVDLEQAEEATTKIEGKERAGVDYWPINLPPRWAWMLMEWGIQADESTGIFALRLDWAGEFLPSAVPFYVLYHQLIC